MRIKSIATFVALSACTLGTLSGCSSSTSDGAAPAREKNTTPLNAPDVLLREVAGYEATDIAKLIEENELASPGSSDRMTAMAVDLETNPAECAQLAPTAMSAIAKVIANPTGIAISEFDSDADGAITVSVNSGDIPADQMLPSDIGSCESFARSNKKTTYTAEKLDISVDNAEDLRAARVTMTGSEIAAMGEAGKAHKVIGGLVDGAYFQVTTSQDVPDETLLRFAQAQVDKITSR
ncbi:hypothetical protein WG915_03910 [Corynebacterium sp. H128]|uniref:hypothetical protein n=1 Tax=Corynebacterium sp. H128 TaxID=3133427 RepID=UPI0030B50962